MGPKLKVDALNTKDRKAQLRGFKRYLSKEIIEGTWTAGDQAYLDFQVAEKLAQITKLEGMLDKKLQENNELKAKLGQIEDRYGQQIADLRTKVNEKCEQIARMTEDNHRFILNRGTDLNHFDAALLEEEQKFVKTREKLSVEIKILNSKLRNMEEFRLQRDGLIEKFSEQLKHLQALEESAETIVTDYQKLDLVNKDRMGQELKDRLLKLSIEFQEASQTETTRSLIRENIAINNELGGHIGSWQLLHDQNRELKRKRYLMRNDLRSEETLKEKCLTLNVLQTQVLERLAFEHQKLDGFDDEIETLRGLKHSLENKLELVAKELREQEFETKILVQNRHDMETRVNGLNHDYRMLLKTVQGEEVTLKKALLHVAEGQDMIVRKGKNRFTAEELCLKLYEVLKELTALVRDDATLRSKSTSREVAEGSRATMYDPDFAIKYWRGQGVDIEHAKETAKEEKTESARDSSSTDSS